MKKELFIHIYTEEIPCKMQQNADIDKKFVEVFLTQAQKLGMKLEENDIAFDKSCVRSIISCNLEEKFISESVLTRGPKIDSNPAAIEGFLRKYNITKNDLEIEDGHYIYKTPQKNLRTVDILPTFLENCFTNWETIWPSVTTWANGLNWPRPIRALTALFDSKLIDFEVSDIKSSFEIRGHKFSSQDIYKKISSKADCYSFLSEQKIILDRVHPEKIPQRLDQIKEKVKSAQSQDLTEMQLEIINEVNTLCESVSIIIGEIDKKFEILPNELIIAVMKNHLKYIPLIDSSGKLNKKFAIIVDTNEENDEKTKSILQGNLRVLNARLEDALFFFNKDKSQKIEFFKEKLSQINFNSKLGNILDSVERIKALHSILSQNFSFKVNEGIAKNTIDLIKLDLGSSMISEFPELQGYMVPYYFYHLADDKNLLEKAAIYQYKTILDTINAGLDTEAWEILLTIWLEYSLSLIIVGEKPTSSKDPFGIRRRLKYVFQCVDKILKIDDFATKLSKIITEYAKKINNNIDTNDILSEILKHKND